MSIYITGDCHADFRKFNMECFLEQKNMTRDDYMIILGDFGGIWDWHGESKNENYWLSWLENKSYTTLFIDGNHENFDRLYAYPVKSWHGGKVHEIRSHVLHLMRGEIFDIDGLSFFAFGGARSHDITAGILDPDSHDFKEQCKYLDRKGALYRINHRTWWAQEMPNEEEKKYGLNMLKKHNGKVDFILTHECSTSVLNILSNASYKKDELNDYFEKIRKSTEYKKWFFGHYHDNQNVTNKDLLLYEQIIRIN